MDKFQLTLLKRVKNNHQINIPLGDLEYREHYFKTVDFLEKSGYIKIDIYNKDFIKAFITDSGISVLNNF